MFFVKAEILLYSLPCFILYRRLKKVEAPFFFDNDKNRALPIMSLRMLKCIATIVNDG